MSNTYLQPHCEGWQTVPATTDIIDGLVRAERDGSIVDNIPILRHVVAVSDAAVKYFAERPPKTKH